MKNLACLCNDTGEPARASMPIFRAASYGVRQGNWDQGKTQQGSRFPEVVREWGIEEGRGLAGRRAEWGQASLAGPGLIGQSDRRELSAGQALSALIRRQTCNRFPISCRLARAFLLRPSCLDSVLRLGAVLAELIGRRPGRHESGRHTIIGNGLVLAGTGTASPTFRRRPSPGDRFEFAVGCICRLQWLNPPSSLRFPCSKPAGRAADDPPRDILGNMQTCSQVSHRPTPP